MAYNVSSNAQTSLVQPITQLTQPIELEDYGSFSVSAHTDIGNRKTQEDRFIIVPRLGEEKHKISFFGVFDGTVGHFSSDTIQKIIVKHLTESQEWERLLNAIDNQGDVSNCASEAMYKMYKSADEELLQLCSKHSHDYASSTSVTVLIVDKLLIVGHLGDSRVSICSEENGSISSKFLTLDHKPNNPEEKMRIISCGGSVEFLCSHSNNPFIRGGDFTVRKARGEQPMQLQYSRAFGGKDLKRYGLSSNPDITVVKLNENHKAIILASDGLWDIKSSEDAFRTLLDGHSKGLHPAKHLIDSALSQQRSRSKNSDNITAIAAFNGKIIDYTHCVKTSLKITPSSLALYPLDFQDIWQSSEPIPVDVNYSVPSFGPRDLANKLQQLKRSTEILKEKEEERNRRERLTKKLETKANSLLSLIRDRIRNAHRVY